MSGMRHRHGRHAVHSGMKAATSSRYASSEADHSNNNMSCVRLVVAVAIGAVGLLFIDNKQGKKYLKPSTSIQKKSNDNIILSSSNGTTDVQHRPSKQGADAGGSGSSNKEEDGDEPQLKYAAVDKFETTGTGTSDVHIYYIIFNILLIICDFRTRCVNVLNLYPPLSTT